MNKIFNYLPIALAGLAFASCSDTDLIGEKQEKLWSDSALSFIAEDLESPDTRAGFTVSTTTPKGTVWNVGDQMRVYDDQLATWDKYEYAGTDWSTEAGKFDVVGEKKIANYTMAAYPANQIEAAYLDKDNRDMKHLQVSLPKEYDYAEKLGGGIGSTELAAYKGELPMWGFVSNNLDNVNVMNYMTAVVRVFYRDIPAGFDHIVLVSTPDPANGPQPVSGRFIVDVPANPTVNSALTDDEIDNQKLLILKKDGAEDFSSSWGNYVTASIRTSDDNGLAIKDSAAIQLPVLAKVTYDDLRVYAYKSTYTGNFNITDLETAVTAGNAIKIGERNATAVNGKFAPSARKKTWVVRYTNTYVIDVDAIVIQNGEFIPGDITDVLNAKANTAIGQFRIVPKSFTNANVLTVAAGAGTDTRTHQIEIPKMLNGIQIELDLSQIKTGTNNDVSLGSALQIYESQEHPGFNGDITIISGKMSTTDLAKQYEFNLPEGNVTIVSDAAANKLPNITAQFIKNLIIGDDKHVTEQDGGRITTIKDGVLTINKLAKLAKVQCSERIKNSDAQDNATDVVVNGGTITNLTIDENVDTDVTMKGGKIALIDVAKLNKDINITSEGAAEISKVNVAADANNIHYLNITSTLTNDADVSDFGVLSFDGTDQTGDFVFTASQLKNLASATANVVIMADNIDLGANLGTPVNYTPVVTSAATTKISGWNYKAAGTAWSQVAQKKLTKSGFDAWTQKYTTPLISNTIKNVNIKSSAREAGLISQLGANLEVNGLNLTGVKYKAGNTTNVYGTLIANANSKDIILNGISISDVNVEAGVNSRACGGAIGEADGKVTALYVDVVADKLAGHYYIGGMLGDAAGANDYAFTDCSTNVTEFAVATPVASVKAGSVAEFIGGGSNTSTAISSLTFKNCKYTAYTDNIANKAALHFIDNVLYKADGDVRNFGGNPWIGLVYQKLAQDKFLVYQWLNQGHNKYYQYNYTASSSDWVGAPMYQNPDCMVRTTYTGATMGSGTFVSYSQLYYDGVEGLFHSTKVLGYNLYKNYNGNETSYDAYEDNRQF